jgi:type VI secretion system secreted protein Hcp
MAQTVHLRLQIDGNDIEGESTIASMDRDGTIECSSFSFEGGVGFTPGSFVLTSKPEQKPVVIVKRIDQSTPLLLTAACKNEPVNYAEFRFFRPAPRQGGAEQHFYTVLLENGFITAVNQVSEDAIVGGEDAPPMMEEVTFIYTDITWTYEIGGATHKFSIGS